ncbi:kinase-like domain-containing protein [Mycena galopus ATCC 62051]|nr:kinase-like domain-containing protein [Mycena galopus ATCC 62051]
MVLLLKDIGVDIDADILISEPTDESTTPFDYEGVDFLAITLLTGLSRTVSDIEAKQLILGVEKLRLLDSSVDESQHAKELSFEDLGKLKVFPKSLKAVTLVRNPGTTVIHGPFKTGGGGGIYRANAVLQDGTEFYLRHEHHDDVRRWERVCRRYSALSRVNHRNILPSIGLYQLPVSISQYPVSIAPFCKFGSVLDYVGNHPDAGRYSLVVGVARGLQYLHDMDIVHGDIKLENILVDKHGIACITDFHFARRLYDYSETYLEPDYFTAPEQLEWNMDRQNRWESATKESDVYSFGLVGLVIFANTEAPFKKRLVFSMPQYFQDLRPKRRDWAIKDWQWTVLDPCWAGDPMKRPGMTYVLTQIEGLKSS